MPLQNPRLLVDGVATTRYVLGRHGEIAVDVSDFAGGEIKFTLQQLIHRGTDTWRTITAFKPRIDPIGAAPTTVTVRIGLNYPWPILNLTGSYDILRQSWSRGEDVTYDLELPIFDLGVDDEERTPPLVVEVSARGMPSVRTPELRRLATPFVDGNFSELFIDGNQALPAMITAINAAQNHVHVNWFFFSPDESGNKIIAALAARAQAGIEVRVLFDKEKTAVPASLGGQGVGFGPVAATVKFLRDVGAEVGFTNDPIVPDQLTDPEYRDRAQESLLWSAASMENMIGTPLSPVDHSKWIIVDGEVVMLGGMNCGIPYLYEIPFDPAREAKAEADARRAAGQPEAFEKWHDLFVKVRGPVVAQVQALFVERWAQITGKNLSRASMQYFPNVVVPAPLLTGRARMIANVPGLERDITFEHVLRFWEAEQKIMIATPYFTDDLLGLYLCYAAKKNNVQVTLLVPDEHLDFDVVRQFMRARFDDWRAVGIKIHEYENHMTHVKIAVVDTRYVIVGSYNFAKGSAMHLHECNLVIDDPRFAQEVEQRLFVTDLARATPVTGPVEVDLVVGSDLAEPFL